MPNISASMRDRILRTNRVSVISEVLNPHPRRSPDSKWLLQHDWIVPMKLLKDKRKKLLRKIRAWTKDPFHPDLNSMIQRLAGLEKSLQEFDRRLHPDRYEEEERILQKRAKFMQMYGASPVTLVTTITGRFSSSTPNLYEVPREV